MSRRYLFGPVPAGFDLTCLTTARESGDCLVFGPPGVADLAVGPRDTWESLVERLPAGWRPDFAALYLPYTIVPECLWRAPVPLIGLAADWNWLFHAYRHLLPRCDEVWTDAPGVEVLTRAGIENVRAVNLFGPSRAFLDGPWPERTRDIDILFVGNLHPAIQRERLPWLGRLARLAEERRVLIATGVYGLEYRDLLSRSKIVFNRSARGECNRRAFEAAVAGALLFQEKGNVETAFSFRDRQECVYYGDDNLEALLEHFLSDETERQAIVAVARKQARSLSFESMWQQAIAALESDWMRLQARADQRRLLDADAALAGRVWQLLSGNPSEDPALARELGAALVRRPGDACLHNALGLVIARQGQGSGPVTAPLTEKASGYFRRAWECDRQHVVAGLNLSEALIGMGQKEAAVEQAKRTLAVLERIGDLGPNIGDEPHFPAGFDLFRVEWERAAWANAGRPRDEDRAKRDLLRWRLHTLLAEQTAELVHFHEAALARPDLPSARAALGCAMGRLGRSGDAVQHLRQAVDANPFDREAARALFQSLGDAGDARGQRALARERRALCRASPHAVPEEPWFTRCPPVGDERASLILLCCNEVEYTRQCLESVLRHTRAPFELILVDNGSNDGTGAYLEEVKQRLGPERVVVVRNEVNRGFPAGCNQGLACARGRYVVFLNNDTVATPGWLEGLIHLSLHDWPKTGLVGAVTNYAPDPQRVEPGYAGLDDLDAFAQQHRARHANQALAVERLSGFCLLARKEVLDHVGGFDERFGLGFFEDDDLCVRVRRAGYQLMVALDVYLHHHGSRTFAGARLDIRQRLEENFSRFKAKWGPEAAAGYRLPEPGDRNQESGVESQRSALNAERLVASTSGNGDASSIIPGDRSFSRDFSSLKPDFSPETSANRPRVSLCMIVKNEEANLPDCLGSAADLVDEIVVADTGSTDRTKEIAAQFGARVVEFPWCDSFAAARNASLEHAAGDWIFWLDADDRLDEANRAKLRSLFASLQDRNSAYVMKCLCLPDPTSASPTLVDHVRLFRNRPDVRWKYRVHEQILPALRAAATEVRWTDIVIHHAGYQDPALRRHKLDRDLRLLGLENAENSDDPFTLFNLGSVSLDVGKPAEALPLLRRSLERSGVQDSIVRKLYALITQCHRHLGQFPEAASACREGRGNYPDDAELLFLEALTRRDLGDKDGAEQCLTRLLGGREGAHFASVDAGLRGYKARHNLAVLYQDQGRSAEAEAQWRAALAEAPGFTPATLGLAEVYLAEHRWGELETLAASLESRPQTAVEATVLRARGCLVRCQFAEARQRLTEIIRQAPEALWPKVILTHVLLQEGRDWVAAEQALRDVLELAPNHAEARRNLDVLLRRRQGPNGTSGILPSPATTLDELYQAACAVPSDIHEHLPTLFALAKECRHVTEFGTRTGDSTTALLAAQPEILVCYDVRRFPQVDRLQALAGPTRFVFHQQDVRNVEIEETDLLFIDTWHVYEQLHEELRLHASKARKYIVLHDTATYGERGETDGHRGLWAAVEEFLTLETFRLKERRENNNGLTVLERLSAAEQVACPISNTSG